MGLTRQCTSVNTAYSECKANLLGNVNVFQYAHHFAGLLDINASKHACKMMSILRTC